MEHHKQGKLLIKRKMLHRLMFLDTGQLLFTPPSHLIRQPFTILIDVRKHCQEGSTVNVERKRNGTGETRQQLDKSRILNSQLFLETLAWWTADDWRILWRMRGGQREPTERSIVLRWPVNSIISSITSLTRSLFPSGAASRYWTVTILLPTGLQLWFNHSPVQKYITLSSLAPCKSLQRLWV